MAGVDSFRLDLKNFLKREHVVVKVFEYRCAFAEDAVPAEDGVILLRKYMILESKEHFYTVALNNYADT